MRRDLGLTLAIGGLSAGGFAVSRFWTLISLAAGGVGYIVWLVSRCHHPRPLGLLPPTVDAQGERVPAQWYCSRCGASWPANLERERAPAPVPRFVGYDPSKAVDAAKRADELANRQRALAVKRSGIKSPAREELNPVSSPRSPIPMRERRTG